MINQIIKKAGISRRHWNYLLAGERSATKRVAIRLSKVLDCDINIWGYGTAAERRKAVSDYLKK